jgi:hypothetical protein
MGEGVFGLSPCREYFHLLLLQKEEVGSTLRTEERTGS